MTMDNYKTSCWVNFDPASDSFYLSGWMRRRLSKANLILPRPSMIYSIEKVQPLVFTMPWPWQRTLFSHEGSNNDLKQVSEPPGRGGGDQSVQ